MPQKIEDDFGEAARHLRVDTLVMLRWSAIIGQTFALLYVYHYLKFEFPIGLCFVAVATSTALNIALRAGTPRSFRLDDSEAAVLLAFDILELAALLYLTGGVVNSFAMLFLAPVMISAVSLPRKLTLLLGILMVAAATLLTVEYLPLPWRADEQLHFPLLYRLGVWSALVLSAAFVGLYAARVSDEARLLAGALSATELVLERAQHLTQLDGLAAAAAHELGTPLATITLITSELQRWRRLPRRRWRRIWRCWRRRRGVAAKSCAAEFAGHAGSACAERAGDRHADRGGRRAVARSGGGGDRDQGRP